MTQQGANAKVAQLSALLVAAALLMVPVRAWAHGDFRGLLGAIYALFIGLPYGVLLLALGIVGLVLVLKKRHRPGLGLFFVLFPTIVSATYVLFPVIAMAGHRFSRQFPQHFVYAAPIIGLTLVVATFGVLLRRRRAEDRAGS